VTINTGQTLTFAYSSGNISITNGGTHPLVFTGTINYLNGTSSVSASYAGAMNAMGYSVNGTPIVSSAGLLTTNITNPGATTITNSSAAGDILSLQPGGGGHNGIFVNGAGFGGSKIYLDLQHQGVWADTATGTIWIGAIGGTSTARTFTPWCTTTATSFDCPSFKAGGVAGFTGTKTAGSCVFTISGGIITNISGC
jgi:hypothetical protein